jgi:hypothetical protein
MQISKTEKILIMLFFAATWAVLALNAGGPIFSDEFLYIDAGLRNFPVPNYGNRYFHIYLQKLFMALAPTPLIGVRIFWGFLIAGTAALIYSNARTFIKHSSPLHGLLALAIFFSYPLITEYSGEPAVDITAMAMVTLYVSVYLFALRNPDRKRIALIVLGALAFIAFKTKETTVFVNFLLLGFALDEEGKWNWRALRDLIRPLLTGLAAGIGLFILLDGLILGKPFFAISPATFAAVFKNYDFQPGFFFGPTSWYKVYFLDELLLPFLLFILSAVKLGSKTDTRRRLVWIYPLILAIFVTWNMLKVTFGFIERFYFPALPVIAMLAPQYLHITWPDSRKKWLMFTFMAAGAAGLLLILRSAMITYSASFHFEFLRFLDSIYYPILISILIGAAIWSKKFHWAVSIIPLFCIAAMLLSPLLYTYKYFFAYPKVQERYDLLFYPFETFKDELITEAADKLLISADIKRSLEMLSDDPNDITGMANFFFDWRIGRDSVAIGYNLPGMQTALVSKDIDQALISGEDWQALSSQAGIAAKYDATIDQSGQVVLLTSNK